ncbi:acetamidase/formamidase family protein [Actinomadura gamaensis]|uniref:Acetamidase/formamidase family protein n=1 Tax=Actinomadura gamaensis TaxID=1763541 RepID=A0ABV9TSG4_9ACTN
MPSPLIDAPRRWHPEIPAEAEVITGGTARLAVPAAGRSGPLVVVGAQPGDVVLVDVLSVTGPRGLPGHPSTLGCASPDPGDAAGCARAADGRALDADGRALDADDRAWDADDRAWDADDRVRAADGRALDADGCAWDADGCAWDADGVVRGDARDAAGCAVALLTAGSRVLLPVRVLGARLHVGALHLPARGACRVVGGSVELRVNLTRRGVERFAVSRPILLPDPSPTWR